MCGIAGFLDRKRGLSDRRGLVERMVSALVRRGPDDSGAWVDEGSAIALGHRRLSIVDLSPAGQQPMLSADNRFAMIFNGEIYNHAELRAELDAISLREWRGHSDTEVLLEAIARWGVSEALARSVGMFALALWDRRDRRLTLARDRLGEKPLYYGWLGGCFSFASEIKALRVHPDWSQDIDRNSLALLMRHGYVPAPYSIYRGVSKLRPGHLLSLDAEAAEPRIERYWSAFDAALRGAEAPFSGSPADAVEALEALMRASLKGQMVADVPLGAFLSGGIDSSAVVAVMQSMSTRPVRTFTIGFDEPAYNEAEHAKKVAAHLGTDHTELYVTDRQVLDVIPQLPTIYCEPFADSSQIPTYLVSALARQSVTVSLSGDGGDELFSGYPRYALADGMWGGLSRIPASLRKVAARLATAVPPQAYDRVVGPLIGALLRKHRHARLGDRIHKAAEVVSLATLDDVYRRLCSHWAFPDKMVIGASEPPTMLSGLEAVAHRPTAVERMMYIDLLSYLPDDILVKVDRAAMAVSLETRVPLLDHRIVEFALSLPLAIARAGGVGKWPLRQLLYRYVPQRLVDRPKMGFGIPIDALLRGSLREWGEDLLSEARLKREGYFRPEPIRRAWDEHLSGARNNQYPLWNVLAFQAWISNQASPNA